MVLIYAYKLNLNLIFLKKIFYMQHFILFLTITVILVLEDIAHIFKSSS